jgi:hypothetical protein
MHSPILMFQSSHFAAIPGEDELTNPGIFGRQLAEWVAAELPALGFELTGPAIPEDFGWCVPVAAEECDLYVACANAEEGWQAFVFAESGLMARLLDHDPRPPAVSALYAALFDLLQRAPHIDDLREDA